MTGIPPAAPPPGFAAKQGHTSSLQQNSARLVTLAQALASLTHPQAERKADTFQLFTFFVSLARGIDFAVANNDIPANAKSLPVYFKQLCQPKHDSLLQSANMLVVLSIKNACKVGWFSSKETQELLRLVDEVESSFCNAGGIHRGLSNMPGNVSDIMSRYYPSMKMGNILAYMEAKPGYQALMGDFHISKNEVKSAEDKLWLLVAQTDNIETSACIATPQDVNFLINGKGVEKRINVYMDSGPQMPTSLTAMLKYGTNLLQAIGQFNGHYFIAIAFMSVVSLPDAPELPDYVHSDLPAPDLDPDLIEGPSRISLNCPISRGRINIPVKGVACKHLQCFDYKNYVNINTRRPSWRCPHCNQHVCYTEIRIDQNMVKVLKEVSKDISEVIISEEGSWKAVLKSDDSVERGHDNGSQQEPIAVSNVASAVLDLTRDDNEMDVDAIEMDLKPPVNTIQNQSTAVTSAGVNHGPESWMRDDFWSELMVNGSDAQAAVGVSLSTSNMQFNPTTRVPTPTQAFTAPSQTAPPQQRPRTSPYTHIPTTNGFAPSQTYSVPQGWNQQNRTFPPNQPQVGVSTSAQLQLLQQRLWQHQQRAAQGTGNNQDARMRGRAALPVNPEATRAPTTPELPSDGSWRPADRMRGSLTGREHQTHLREYIIHPTQQTDFTPLPVAQPPRVPLPPGLQPYLENGGNFRLPSVQHDAATGPGPGPGPAAGMNGDSGGLL